MKRRSKLARDELPVLFDEASNITGTVKSAVRVMQVFEFFDQVQRDAHISEIVEHLGFPQSSTSALMKSLVRCGYIEYLPLTRTYTLTPRVALLGSWIEGSPLKDGSIGRMMDELNAETSEAIVLACSNGIYSKYIHVVEASSLIRMHVPIGTTRLLVWSTTGVALISQMSDEAIRLLVKRTNAQAPSTRRPIDANQTLVHVDQYRKRGYFFSRGLMTSGAGMISMRLPPTSAGPDRPLAIGIGGPVDTIQKQETRIVRLLRDAIAKYIKITSSN